AGEDAIFILVITPTPALRFQHAVQPRPTLLLMKGEVAPDASVQAVQQ
ncbi:MAG: hypothetical protein GX433_16735, partial [Deltaproteobacteria bacterium]|nr:hypothetical protein [Deltaproteobacteria bacterium]